MFTLKKIIVIVLFLISFIIGYARETIFLVINAVIHNYPYPYNISYVKPPSFLYQLPIESLTQIKWLLTFVFSMVFMGVCLLITNFYFKNKRYNYIVIFTYTLLLIIASFVVMLGYLFNAYNAFYTFSRMLAGVMQSPIFPIFLFIAFYINQNRRKSKDSIT